MPILIAFAQAGAGAAGQVSFLDQFMASGAPMLLGLAALFYFMILRPQQKMRDTHQKMLAALKRGDVIVTSGGLIGKVKSVADDEVRVELAPNTEVRVVRATIAEVRSKTDPAPANDTKAAAD